MTKNISALPFIIKAGVGLERLKFYFLGFIIGLALELGFANNWKTVLVSIAAFTVLSGALSAVGWKLCKLGMAPVNNTSTRG